MKMANAVVYDIGTRGQTTDMSVDTEKRSWLYRRLYDLGVYDMAPSTRPPELRLNYSTALFYLAVISAIAGGFWFTYDRIATVNFQAGQEAERRIQQDKEMDSMKRELKLMKDLKEAERTDK